MIYTWAADVAPLLDPIIYEAYYREVPQWRQEKADRIRFSEDRALSIGAYVLYQKALRESGLSTEMCFNLSHSGHYVLCSIADEKEKRTGCDLEKIGTPGQKIFLLVRMAIYSGTGIRGRANGSVLPLLGSQRKFYESDKIWDEASSGFL